MTAHEKLWSTSNFVLMTFTYILLSYEESLKICEISILHLHDGTHQDANMRFCIYHICPWFPRSLHFFPQGNLMYSKSNFVRCVYHLTMNGRFKTSVLILSLTKLMWPPLIDWNDCLFAGFWCGTLEEFVGPNWDEITLNDALQAYAISDIWWEFVTWKSVCGELNDFE